jgi:hypothetical protein
VFAKREDIKLMPHMDEDNPLSKELLQQVLKEDLEVPLKVASMRWVVKYTAVAKERGVIENKGYNPVSWTLLTADISYRQIWNKRLTFTGDAFNRGFLDMTGFWAYVFIADSEWYIACDVVPFLDKRRRNIDNNFRNSQPTILRFLPRNLTLSNFFITPFDPGNVLTYVFNTSAY